LKFCPSCDQHFDDDLDLCPEHGLKLLRLLDPDGAEDLLIGRTIEGRYEIDGRIGAGGMGAVYSATQAMVGRRVAIKVLKPDVANDVMAVKRFMQEARTASALSHPNTITIHDFGQTGDGLLYLVMEFVAGETLDAVSGRDGAMPPARAAHIVRQILNALQEAHGAGVVHRDLKPDNVLISPQAGNPDFLKVLDFGLAKVTGENASEGGLTRTGQVFGTPAYMSPEQARGEVADARADLYAVGCILYELLSGRRPFEAEQPLALLVMHLQDPPPPFETLDPPVDVPAPLARVVMRAMEKAREARYATATEMLEDLADALEQAGIHTGYTSNPKGLAPIPSGFISSPALDQTMLPTDSGQILEAAFDETMLPTDSGQIYGAGGVSSPALDATIAPTGSELDVALDSDLRGGMEPPPAARSRGPLVGLGLAVLAVGAGAAWWVQRPQPVEPAPTPPPVVAAAAPAPPDARVVDAAPPKTVHVPFESTPAGAQVEVRVGDGEKVVSITTPGGAAFDNGARIRAAFTLAGHAELVAERTVRPGLKVVETLFELETPEPAAKPTKKKKKRRRWGRRQQKVKPPPQPVVAPPPPPPPPPKDEPVDCLDCDLK